MNLSFMSVGNKQINPGLTYFVLTAAELDSINLPCNKPPSTKTEVTKMPRDTDFVSHIRLFYVLFTTYRYLTSGKGCSFQTS